MTIETRITSVYNTIPRRTYRQRQAMKQVHHRLEYIMPRYTLSVHSMALMKNVYWTRCLCRLLRVPGHDSERPDTSGRRNWQVRISPLHQSHQSQREDRVSLWTRVPAHWSSRCYVCQRPVESTWIAQVRSEAASACSLHVPRAPFGRENATVEVVLCWERKNVRKTDDLDHTAKSNRFMFGEALQSHSLLRLHGMSILLMSTITFSWLLLTADVRT